MKGDIVLYFSSFKIGISIFKGEVEILGETTLVRMPERILDNSKY